MKHVTNKNCPQFNTCDTHSNGSLWCVSTAQVYETILMILEWHMSTELNLNKHLFTFFFDFLYRICVISVDILPYLKVLFIYYSKGLCRKNIISPDLLIDAEKHSICYWGKHFSEFYPLTYTTLNHWPYQNVNNEPVYGSKLDHTFAHMTICDCPFLCPSHQNFFFFIELR